MEEFRNGLKDGLPICLGYFGVSLAFGLNVTKNGLGILSSTLMSLTNMTSAGQFACAQILIEHGALLEIFLTTLVINIRYFLMSLSVSQKLDNNVTILERMLIAFGMTDEIFAMAIKQKTVVFKYMMGLIILPVIGWTFGTLVGGLFADILSKELIDALGISLYCMFIAILTEPSKSDKYILLSIVISIIFSTIFYYVPSLSKLLSNGYSVILAAIISSVIMAFIHPIKEES